MRPYNTYDTITIERQNKNVICFDKFYDKLKTLDSIAIFDGKITELIPIVVVGGKCFAYNKTLNG